ncbi:MAG TPA: hypothetical protein DEB06_07665 [Phycisphaerales bacterium]|nr:hypothetical protein [Phycisphaerales bacterium]
MAFGIFGKKKDEAGAGAEAPAGSASGGGFETNPDAARRFFDRAQTVHDSTNFEYAMVLWLQGLSQDPTGVEGLEKFMRSGSKFAETNKKPSKDQLGQVKARHAGVQKYLAALLQWGVRQLEWPLALDAFEAAAKLELAEPAYWIGARALGLAGQDSKAKKAHFVKMMELFSAISAFDKAVVAGELAYRLDPTDAKLQNTVRNMSAQSAMNRGGYEESGKQGGFRSNIRDLSAQRAKEAEERLVKTEDDQTVAINNAKADYESRPTDSGAIEKYARLLRERGTPADEKAAYEVLMKAFESTGVFRFRQQAGELKMRAARRKLRAMVEQGEALGAGTPQREQADQAVAKAQRQVVEMEIGEYAEWVENYPTNMELRYELGSRCLQVGQYEKAIGHFQESRAAPKVAEKTLLGLAQAFEKLGWLEESESTYREAIAKHENPSDDLAVELRYGLMSALEARARDEKKLEIAEEALKLASSIAIQRIGFRDIRDRRQALQELVRSMRP